MKIINDILCIEYPELVEAGISENTIKHAKLQNSKSWGFIQDPEDARKVLIEYEKLKVNYKELIKAKFGDPYNYFARQPIKNMVLWDDKAEQFYLSFKYGENKNLSDLHVRKYSLAASWLNMLQTAMVDKPALKKMLSLTIDQFWINVCELIKETQVNKAKNPRDYIDLPTSTRRLMARMKEYKEKGYGCLVDPQFGNKKAAKVKDIGEDLLVEMIAHPNQYNDVYIANTYNEWARLNNHKEITAAAVGVWRREKDAEITGERNGADAFNEKYIKQVKGMRPSFPLALVEHDDNHLDLLFQDMDITVKEGRYYHKYKAIVVIDSYNDYVLGYAYSLNAVTVDTIKAAYLNAMYHIRSLTDGWHLPVELKSDRWAIESLQTWYESIGIFIPPARGNKHRGYIEQFFGSSLWKNSIKVGSINYTGNNTLAKTRGINVDLLKDTNRMKEFPQIGEEATQQIEQIFYRLRHTPGASGKTKQQVWLDAWAKLPADKKRPIDDSMFLFKFGIEHNYRGQGIQITNRGVEPTINGVKYSFDLEQYDLGHIGKTVSVLYDPHDMSRVLLTDFENLRIIARDAKVQPRAVADATVGSRTALNEILKEKRDIVAGVGAKSDKRKKALSQHTIDADAVLLSGAVSKELKQAAEMKILVPTNKQHDDYNLFDQI